MTLADGKRKVYMLLDEYSSGGSVTKDDDIEKKMADFFDTAQKDIANYKRIIKNTTIELTGQGADGMAFYDLPENFAGIFRIWKNGRTSSRYAVIGGKLAVPASETGSVLLEYYATPATVGENTPDTYIFEVSEDAANCLPFYVAAQHLMPDLVVDYSAFWNTYLTMRAALDVTLPTGGTVSVRQSLFR